jgi:hypothetical protein
MLDINLYSLEGTDEFSGKWVCYGRCSIPYRFLNMMSMTVVQTVPQFSLCSSFLIPLGLGCHHLLYVDVSELSIRLLLVFLSILFRLT